MQPNPIAPQRYRIVFAAVCWFLPVATARAEDPPLRDLLRDGLYAEEVTRDAAAAANQYEQVLARYAEQRELAATALFRLAEVRRKQDRKDDAIQLYQKLLTEFPDSATQAKLARENLATLGAKVPEPGGVVTNPELAELARLENMATTAPDFLLDPSTLQKAVSSDWSKVVRWLLTQGSRPYEGGALPLAAQRGNLEIVRLLTDTDAVVPQTIATKSILSAIENDRHTILEYLLKKGFKPGMTANEFGEMPVFIEAVLKGHLRGAEILLQHGADPNAMAEARTAKDFSPCGTALHLTSWTNDGKFAAANWLLEKGAKPDIPDPYYGLTPLHYAAQSETPGADKMMGKLLDAGADPNRRSNARMVSDGLKKDFLLNSTPLEIALAFGSPATRLEKVRLLLKHGAKPNLEGSKVGSALAVAMLFDDPRVPELVQVLGDAGYPMTEPKLLESAIKKNDPKLIGLLFKYGANPNLRQFGDSLLVQTCMAGDAARLALLVKAGADVHALSSDGRSALRIAASPNSGDGMSCVELLLAAGAKPDDKWRERGFDQTQTPIRHVLIDQFIIPTLVSESDIFLLVDQLQNFQTLRMATRSGKAQAPGLAAWLLANHTEIRNYPSGDDLKPRGAIWRKNDRGELVKLDVDLNRAPEIPALRWGDVVSVMIDLPKSYSGGSTSGLPKDVLWSLRKRIAFPITVEIEGKTREITVRGDRIFFDPTRNEVPLQSAQYVIELLRPPNACSDSVATAIVISRQGWPDVRLAYSSQEAKKFPLEAGDRVKLEVTALSAGDIAAARRKAVFVEVADYPFARKFPPAVICTPTLIQAFVEMQLPWVFTDMRWAEVDWKTLREYSAFGTSVDFNLLPHPDLSRIRIHRLQEDGAEKVIDVDLAKIIAAATDLTTPEEARQADVMLQAGDIVEISLLKDRLDQPWKGFTAAEETFFNKALAGRVQVIDSDGKVTIRELNYRQPRFIETESGWIPVTPKTGVASVRASWVTRAVMVTIKRKDGLTGEAEAQYFFLRDGDEVRTGNNQLPRPRVLSTPSYR